MVRVDSVCDWRDGGGGIAVGVRLGVVERGRIDDGRFGAVAVAFQDFFGGDVCAVAEEAGVAASTLSRIGHGAKPDVNGLAALLAWSNLKAESFIRGAKVDEPEPLAKITALLRADPHLTPQNAQLIEDIVVTTYSKLRGA